MNRVQGAILVVVLLPVTSLAAGCTTKQIRADSARTQPEETSRVFNQTKFAACLHQLLLSYETLRGSEMTDPLNSFAGLTGYNLVTTSPSVSDPGARASIDTVQLFFFKNSRQAQNAQPSIARLYVYFHGPFAYLRALRPTPPDASSLHSIERIVGNVDIFWNYPRHNASVSDHTLDRCLKAS